MYHTCNIIHYLTYLATFNTHLPYNRLYLPISILFKLYHYSCYIFIVISLSLSNYYICITLTVFITHISQCLYHSLFITTVSQYLYHSLFITTVSLMSITPVSLSPCLWLLVSVPESLPTCWYLCLCVTPGLCMTGSTPTAWPHCAGWWVFSLRALKAGSANWS